MQNESSVKIVSPKITPIAITAFSSLSQHGKSGIVICAFMLPATSRMKNAINLKIDKNCLKLSEMGI